MKLRLESIKKNYGTFILNADLELHEGEFHTFLGPSGCGKTTLLRIIAGFTAPDSGHIYLDGKDITEVPPEKRNISIVFQDYALFPNMTVEKNIGYGLRHGTGTGIKSRPEPKSFWMQLSFPDTAKESPTPSRAARNSGLPWRGP